jgi:hypothetical protein
MYEGTRSLLMSLILHSLFTRPLNERSNRIKKIVKTMTQREFGFLEFQLVKETKP